MNKNIQRNIKNAKVQRNFAIITFVQIAFIGLLFFLGVTEGVPYLMNSHSDLGLYMGFFLAVACVCGIAFTGTNLVLRLYRHFNSN